MKANNYLIQVLNEYYAAKLLGDDQKIYEAEYILAAELESLIAAAEMLSRIKSLLLSDTRI